MHKFRKYPPAIFVQVFSLKVLISGLEYGNIRPWKSDPAAKPMHLDKSIKNSYNERSFL